MNVVFDLAARAELTRIAAWIADENPHAAADLMARIEAKVMRLAAPGLAHMGRAGLVLGTRELIEAPYIIVYRVDDDRQEIVVMAVFHAARDR